ncbi:MAG TPA: hypothetical protein VNE63_16905 [Candidatus Acidoferrales bacterium]|nr:hypothetical protein [Candidatus Acidoferrales bacterium]
MKTMRTAIASLGVLVLLAFATIPARATPTNCTLTPNTCNFGSTVVGTAGGNLTGNNHDANFSETVYLNGGIYSYVFTITPQALNTTAISWGDVSFTYDNFNGNYGVVTDQSTATLASAGFVFNNGDITVNFTPLGTSGNFTFYLQSSMGPINGGFQVGDTGGTNIAKGLVASPEPNVLTLLGSLLFALVLGIPFASRLRTATA